MPKISRYNCIYTTKAKKLPGSRWADVYKKAHEQFLDIKEKSKRRPYIKSKYFNKDKIFLGLFWHHLHEKRNLRDKTQRLKLFPCAIELIRNSCITPESKENTDRKSEILHRFTGKTNDGDIFFVQIKEDKRSGQKYFISVFPLSR